MGFRMFCCPGYARKEAEKGAVCTNLLGLCLGDTVIFEALHLLALRFGRTMHK